MTRALTVNQAVSLQELGGASPVMVFAIGWLNSTKDGLLNKVIGNKHETDLDLSCAIYDKNGDRIDCVWYAQLNSKDGAIRHKGDDTVGVETGDDEVMILDLNQLSSEAKSLFFVISTMNGQSLGHVDQAYWRLFDGQSKRELARYEYNEPADIQAKIIMRLQKVEKDGLSQWSVKALDHNACGQNIQEVFPEIRTLIDA